MTKFFDFCLLIWFSNTEVILLLFVIVQLQSPALIFVTPWTAAGKSFHWLTGSKTHVHCVGNAIHHLTLCCPLFPLRLVFPSIKVFSKDQLFTSGSQSIGTSASDLPVNFQGWFPLGLTGLISLLSKGLSRVFSSTILQKLQFFNSQSSLGYNSHIHTWLMHNVGGKSNQYVEICYTR